MKRFTAVLSVLLAAAFSLAAGSVRDLDIRVVLDKSGSAHITEVWDVNVTDGTEWYLVRNNLGDIVISGLKVTDETGRKYVNEGEWDVDRSREAKAGRCGVVTKSNGCEICWGIGTYDRHVFTVSYVMSNSVKSLDDYDMLHIQFVSPGLSSAPRHVRLTLSAEGTAITEENSRIWGFGYEGTMIFGPDGTVVAESDGSFKSSSSLIALIRFDKGIFSSASVQNRPFQDVLDRAMDGADFKLKETKTERLLELFSMLIWVLPLLVVIVSQRLKRLKRKQILGCSMKDVSWSRDLPFDGNIIESDYILECLGVKRKSNAIASAMILDMVNRGCLLVSRDADDRVEISFNDNKPELQSLPSSERVLYSMMKQASGSDMILQDKEFSRWSKRHSDELVSWTESISVEAKSMLSADGYYNYGRYSPEIQPKAQGLIGFRNYLNDFTLVKERHTQEVALWKEYLVFASLFGIADRVARELKDIDPVLYQEVVTAGYDPNLLWMTNRLANSITNVTTQVNTDTKAFGGFGGGASFGGGGGFSGGGFGGGSR